MERLCQSDKIPSSVTLQSTACLLDIFFLIKNRFFVLSNADLPILKSAGTDVNTH